MLVDSLHTDVERLKTDIHKDDSLSEWIIGGVTAIATLSQHR